MVQASDKVEFTSNFNEKVRSVKNGVYTYIAFDSNGNLFRDRLKVLYTRLVNHNGIESYLLIAQGPGKYKKSVLLIEDKEFLLYEGAVEPNIDTIVHTGTADWDQSGHCIECKRWPPYNNRYFLRAIVSCQVKPLIYNYNKEVKPEILLTCQVIS